MKHELRRYNFRSSPDTKLTVSPDSIPTLVPAESLKLFQGDDPAPYYKIEAIDFPTQANGWTYTEDFWRSFVAKMNERPIPGSRDGHEMRYGARGPTDLILVGGKIESKGDGAGTVYLKNYIMPKGQSGDNSTFIAENKAGMVEYSIVAYTKDQVTTLADGTVKRECVESMGGERNDAVDVGAMNMKMNAEGQALNKKCVSFVRSCIASGKLDSSSPWSFSGADGDALLGANGDDWANYGKYHMVEDQGATEDTKARWKYPVGKKGKVYRSALRAIASRAAQQGLQDVSDTASSLIKEIDKKGKGNRMDETKEEVLRILGNLKANAEITLPEVAKAMGLESQLLTPEHVDALRVVNALKEAGIKDPVAEFKAAKEREARDAETVRAAALDTAFGADKDKEHPNLVRQYAAGKVGQVNGEELTKAIEALKQDPVAKKLAADRADPTSEENILGSVDHKGGEGADDTGRRVDVV